MMQQCGYSGIYPERAHEVINGLTEGMNIGFEGQRDQPRDAQNLISAVTDPLVEAKVHELIMINVDAGKTAGPFRTRPMHNFCVSPIGAVPKRVGAGQVQKVTDIRVIHHLSHPFGGDSINNGSVDIGIKLGSFDEAADAVVKYGRGCVMTKLDVKAAYKLVPVREDDWHLLGFRWRGQYYYERTLPFGLKSSCRQWEAYATALHFAFETIVGVPTVVHYVDDFLLVEKNSLPAQDHLQSALALCSRVGLPIAHDKTEGPTTRLTFLGIELDSMTMSARLSADRLLEFTQLLSLWEKKTFASVRQLQSLAGKLNWACKVVRPGRSFLRRIIDHTTSLGTLTPSTEVKIPSSVYLDIRWWSRFAPEWNGVSLLYEKEWTDATKIEMYTDACKQGYGARYGNRWIAGEWSKAQLKAAKNEHAKDTEQISMPYLELLALTLAVQTWGHCWNGKRITLRSDCLPVVQAIEKRSSASERMMALIRHLHHIAATHSFDFTCTHIAGILNVDADLLSRGDIQGFIRLHQHLPNLNKCQDQTRAITPNAL